MTRTEARLIAEELHKLLHNDVKKYISSAVQTETEEWMSTEQAAQFLGVSISYVKQHILDIPHSKVGKLNRFKKSSLLAYLNR